MSHRRLTFVRLFAYRRDPHIISYDVNGEEDYIHGSQSHEQSHQQVSRGTV